MQVLFLSKEKEEVATLEVEPAKIVDAACVVFQGKYYIYSGIEGRTFSRVKFMEVGAPVVLG